MLRISVCNSSDICGSIEAIRWKRLIRLRTSASTSISFSTSSGTRSTRARRYGSVDTYSTTRIRSKPWMAMRRLPSGSFKSLCTIASVPIWYNCSANTARPGSLASRFISGPWTGGRTVTNPMRREPMTASSINRTARASETASGKTATGNTTRSCSGKIGSSEGSGRPSGGFAKVGAGCSSPAPPSDDSACQGKEVDGSSPGCKVSRISCINPSLWTAADTGEQLPGPATRMAKREFTLPLF
jgi:hypothetical protein